MKIDCDSGWVRGWLQATFWVAIVILVMFFLSVKFADAQTHEVAVGGSIIGSNGSGYGFPFYGGTVSGQVHVAMFDVGGSATRSNFPKIGTPGGHREVYQARVSGWAGKNFFAGGNYAYVHGDATRWTKTVHFAGAHAGWRFIGGQRYSKTNKIVVDGRPHYLNVRPIRGRHQTRVVVGFEHEFKTDAAIPNRTNVWNLTGTHDFPLGANHAVRFSSSVSFSRFDQTVLREETIPRMHPTGYSGIRRYSELDRLTGWSTAISVSYLFKGAELF